MNIDETNGYSLIALASTFAIFIGQNLTSEEQGILSGFFSAVGDNLAILSAIPQNSDTTYSN